jgi:hypothetical protein
MAHWFDRLAQPHTRRTTLKTAALAGAALVLPLGRVPQAWGSKQEPCFQPCASAASTRLDTDWNACNKALGYKSIGAYAIYATTLAPPLFLGFLAGSGYHAFVCQNQANIDWRRRTLRCEQADCGDQQKYPGGKPAVTPQQCDPVYQYPCNGGCCSNGSDCCPCYHPDGSNVCATSGACAGVCTNYP